MVSMTQFFAQFLNTCARYFSVRYITTNGIAMIAPAETACPNSLSTIVVRNVTCSDIVTRESSARVIPANLLALCHASSLTIDLDQPYPRIQLRRSRGHHQYIIAP